MKVFIFGTGEYYRIYYKWIKNFNIVALLDNNPEKWGLNLDGHRVISPLLLEGYEYDRIYILSISLNAIKKQLLDLGVPEEKIYYYFQLRSGCIEMGTVPSALTDKKKLIMISHDLSITGAQKTLLSAAKILIEDSYHVIIGSPFDGRLREEFLAVGAEVIVDEQLRTGTIYDIKWLENCDVLFINTVQLYYLLRKRYRNIPTIWWIHEPEILYKSVLPDLIRTIETENLKIYTVSDVAKNALYKVWPNVKAENLLYGIPDNKGTGNKSPEGSMPVMKFTIIGQISEIKGHDILLQAISLLPDKDKACSEFWFVGNCDTDFGRKISAEVQRMGLPVLLHGAMENSEVLQLLDVSDVLICASRIETMSVSSTEGMMKAIPVVVSSEAGIAQYIESGKNGFVFQSENVSELRDAISFCINNREKLSELAYAGRETYLKNFSLNIFRRHLREAVNEAENPTPEDIPCINVSNLDRFHNRKIIIYGAGTYGMFFYSYLRMKGMECNVLCFAVSAREENRGCLYGKPVAAFEDIHMNFNEAEIVMAVSKNNVYAVLKNVKQRRMQGYYWFSQESAAQAAQDIFEIYRKLPMKKNKVFFYCYEGMGYRCNCKYIAEEFLKGRYPVELVWAVSSGEDSRDMPSPIKTVVIGTKEYYRELYTSSVVVENDGKDPFIQKRQGQFCINTWHGYGPFKKVNGALAGNDRKRMKEYYSYYDLFLTASKFYSQVYRDSFCFDGEILECGAPRNDIFFKENRLKEKIQRIYRIPPDKGIVLWAPTFRYDKSGAFDKYDIDMVQVVECIKEKFQQDYVMLYRFHHQLYRSEKRAGYYREGIDVTLYPDIQELLAAADIVITDYSSLMWDFSLQRKPVFLYQKDLEEYTDERGFYAPVAEWPYPQAHTREELPEIIKNFDYGQYISKLNLFFEEYGSCDSGHAAECAVKRIMDKIEGGHHAFQRM